MKKLVILLAIVAAFTACVQTAMPPVSTAPASAQLPVIASFKALPSTILAGESSTLQWEINGAVSAALDQNIGPVALKGETTVSPASTLTYTLTATNRYGTSTATAQVIISGKAPASTQAVDTFHLPLVAVLSVQPANIVSGQTSVLSWDVQNSFDVNISPGFSIIPVKGSREVSPVFPTTYKLTASNSFGTIIATTTLTVSGVQPNQETPVISYFTAIPYVIKKGGSVTLSWKSKEGSSASINNGVGIVDGSGTTTVTPAETTVYTLTVTNPRGAQFQTVAVNVK
jgi:hypothetical protein